jgi:hypothetical protein
VVFWFSFDIKREQLALMQERAAPRGAQSHLTERIKPAPRHRRENQFKEKTNPAATPHQIVITDPQERKRV